MNKPSLGDPPAILIAEPHPVAFRDCSARVAGLGWAQSDLLRWFDPLAPEVPGGESELCLSAAIPAGTTVGEFLGAVARLVRRHETLRTRFHAVDGRLTRQEAVGRGEVEVTGYRAAAGETATDGLLRARVGGRRLDIRNGQTFRAGFVADDGKVARAAFAVSRLIADAAGCENLVSAFAAELAAVRSGAPENPEPAFQQLDQVDWEVSEPGRRAQSQAADHWREQMAAVQAMPRPGVLDGGTMQDVVVPGEPVLDAAAEVAQASGTSVSGVVLAAFLQATAQTLGLDALGCYLSCSNRTGLGRQESITRLKNLAVYAYAPEGTEFRPAARAVFRDSLRAYRHAQSPCRLLLPGLDTAADRGPFIWYNDVRSVVSTDAAPTDQTAPAAPESLSVPSLEPYLSFGVGAVMGSGSIRPILRIETNLLRTDGITELFELMHGVLDAARPGKDGPTT